MLKAVTSCLLDFLRSSCCSGCFPIITSNTSSPLICTQVWYDTKKDWSNKIGVILLYWPNDVCRYLGQVLSLARTSCIPLDSFLEQSDLKCDWMTPAEDFHLILFLSRILARVLNLKNYCSELLRVWCLWNKVKVALAGNLLPSEEVESVSPLRTMQWW